MTSAAGLANWARNLQTERMALFDRLRTETPAAAEPTPLAAAEAASLVVEAADAAPPPVRHVEAILEKTPRGVELLRAARKPPEFNEQKQALFLEHLMSVPNRALAALRCGVLESQVRGLEKADPAFAQAVQMARSGAAGYAEAEAWRRGVHGIERSVYYKGEVIDTELEYSDGLLTKVLEGNLQDYEKKTKVDANIRHSFDWMDLAEQARKVSEGNSGSS